MSDVFCICIHCDIHCDISICIITRVKYLLDLQGPSQQVRTEPRRKRNMSPASACDLVSIQHSNEPDT